MNKIIDYIVLQRNSHFGLSDKVCREIERGWEPLGGVAVSGGWLVKIYVQAMVKYADE